MRVGMVGGPEVVSAAMVAELAGSGGRSEREEGGDGEVVG